MMSPDQLIARASAEGFTQEDARAIVKAEVDEMVSVLGLTEEEARRRMLTSIGYWTGYLDNATADRIMDLFETEHPIYGRGHHTPEEALRIAMEHGRRMKEQKEKT